MRKIKIDEGHLELLRKLDEDQAAWKSLEQWLVPRFNIFDVLGITRMEIRHNNVLAWLMDSSGTHNLGGAFLEKMIHRIQARNRDKDCGFLEVFVRQGGGQSGVLKPQHRARIQETSGQAL